MKPLTLIGLAALGVGGIFTGLNQVNRVKLPGQTKQDKTQVRNVQHQVESIERRNSDERPTYYIPGHAAILILE